MGMVVRMTETAEVVVRGELVKLRKGRAYEVTTTLGVELTRIRPRAERVRGDDLAGLDVTDLARVPG